MQISASVAPGLLAPPLGKVSAMSNSIQPLTTPTAATPSHLPALPDAPPAPSNPSVSDTFHGTKVSDPFRPLENLDAPETISWWKANNARTEQLFKAVSADRAQAKKWHEDIRNYTRESMESVYGSKAFFTKQAGLESQPTYYVRDVNSPNSKPSVLIDPKTLSRDGTVAVSTMDPSPDGSVVAYTVSESGSDWQTMRFRDTATGKDIHEPLSNLRFTSATWDTDGKGILYEKPLPQDQSVDGKAFGVFHHTLGSSPEQDKPVFSMPKIANSFVGALRLDDNDPYTFFSVSSGTNPEEGLYVQRPGEATPTEILPPQTAAITPFYRDAENLYAVTDKDAERSRIVKIDMKNPAPSNWVDIVSQSDNPADKLQWGKVVGGKLLVGWSKGGADAIDVRSLDGSYQADVPLPIASKASFGKTRSSVSSAELMVGGFLSPGARYRYNSDDNSLSLIKKSDIPKDLSEIATVERRWATSKDGTKIPMWMIAPKGLKLTGDIPTVIYSYGGFNSPQEPGFSYGMAQWVEQGGVYVVANLRGGGEFGKPWYDGGRLKNKQNTFDDLAAVAKQLAADKVTSAAHTAIQGGSNGGLTTAATSQQYPELFGAVISEVPVADMLRFSLNNYGAAWMSDYGNPRENANDFSTSMKYSPLHNVKPASEVKYPPTLIMTGDHDDRVAPWHAMKWAATRQAAGHQASTFLRVAEQAGHGAGKPTSKVIEEAADRYAFLIQTIGKPTPPSNM